MLPRTPLLILLATLANPAAGFDAPAELLYGNPQTVTLEGYNGDAMEPFLSRDGRWLLFNNLNEPSVDTNLHYAERIDDLTFRYRGEIEGANSTSLDGVPTLDRDNRFYFASTRSYFTSYSTLHRGVFRDGVVSGVELLPGISRVEPGIVNFDVEVSPDGQTLYFVDGRFGPAGLQSADLVIAAREGEGFMRRHDSAAILASVNTDDLEYAACISADGLMLLFTRLDLGPPVASSVFVARRARRSDPFGAPTRLAALDGFVEAPTLSPDERAIYYHRRDGERFVLYRAARWGSLPASAQIAYMQTDAAQPFPGPGNDGSWDLVAMNLDGSGREPITSDPQQEFLPQFSPDGTRLLYTRYASGGYGIPGSPSSVVVYDFATRSARELTSSGADSYPVWSPDGRRIAFLSGRDPTIPGLALWVMDADGGNAREIARPAFTHGDHGFGDIAWSSRDWILFVVAQNNADNSCFKTRLDKIRPDGTQRTQVSDGGPNCTPPGMEQNGDADPGYSADGSTIYSSRGFPVQPPGFPGGTVRRLYALSDEPWFPGKPERDLSLASAPDCIEGVPRGSPDGRQVLQFRACADERAGVSLTDANGSFRRWIAAGFGPAWNPARQNANQRGMGGVWFDPAAAGQGFGLEVYPDLAGPGEGFLFGGWFTFDIAAGDAGTQRWYSLAGSVRADAQSHALAILRNTGGNFAAPPATQAQQVGLATLAFRSCTQALLDYAFAEGSGRTGSIVLQQATPRLACNASAPSPGNADAALSGFWHDPTTPGQGLLVEINPDLPLAFVVWYSYAVDGAAAGAAGQRWFTAQAPYVAGSRNIAMTLHETTGGVFDAGMPAPATRAVGSAQLDFSDCTNAVLDYAFSAGDNAGRAGSITLARALPAPAGCLAAPAR